MRLQKIERLNMLDRIARKLDDGVERARITMEGTAGRFIAVELSFVMDAADDDTKMLNEVVTSLPKALREIAAAIEAKSSGT